ncbi:taspase, threonine aspartase, 1 [Phytophthora boehmeriae]|uniref:Taspase, threonine aspartase, 1 n=1 Tax=Phytophthora boehmeriae TaxID=109152 RepID=A0A8T1VN13_9STRA|nr:taspase, threonine aspartase, 1 [Phytophthora boehmeriae]
MSEWLLAVHSGAGRYGSANEAAYLSLLRSALESGREAISRAGSPPTAAQIAALVVQSFEHSALTNAGLGANLTENRRVECAASVVCGRTRLVGACAAVAGVREPSALALKLLEQAETVEKGDTTPAFAFGRQPPLVVVGEHAREVARGFGLETASDGVDELERYQVTTQAEKQWKKWHRRFQSAAEATENQIKVEQNEEEERLDTVGAICMDPMGNVAVALSSGGVAYKVPGRVGLAGCPRMGCDAANAVVPAVTKAISRKRKRSGASKSKNAFAVACTGRVK